MPFPGARPAQGLSLQTETDRPTSTPTDLSFCKTKIRSNSGSSTALHVSRFDSARALAPLALSIRRSPPLSSLRCSTALHGSRTETKPVWELCLVLPGSVPGCSPSTPQAPARALPHCPAPENLDVVAHASSPSSPQTLAESLCAALSCLDTAGHPANRAAAERPRRSRPCGAWILTGPNLCQVCKKHQEAQ